MITRHQTVLDALNLHGPSGTVSFWQVAEDGEDPAGTTVHLPLDLWQELGEPEVITVAVEPGDRLNP